jgi:uncharacterized protein
MHTDVTAEELRAANRAVVEAFFASNLANPEERLALWHPEGVKELPFAPAGLPKTRWEGRDEIVANTLRTARAKGRTPLQAPAGPEMSR